MAVQHIIGVTSAEMIKNRVIVKQNECFNESQISCNDRFGWEKVTLPDHTVKPSHCHSLSRPVPHSPTSLCLFLLCAWTQCCLIEPSFPQWGLKGEWAR